MEQLGNQINNFMSKTVLVNDAGQLVSPLAASFFSQNPPSVDFAGITGTATDSTSLVDLFAQLNSPVFMTPNIGAALADSLSSSSWEINLDGSALFADNLVGITSAGDLSVFSLAVASGSFTVNGSDGSLDSNGYGSFNGGLIAYTIQAPSSNTISIPNPGSISSPSLAVYVDIYPSSATDPGFTGAIAAGVGKVAFWNSNTGWEEVATTPVS